MKAKVTLVGAGPGDPELLTIKGANAIKNAKVILYDALAGHDILKLAPNALTVFVGKRKGNHTYSQDKINELLVHYALLHGDVVRLKGGDSFVFGRGSEEIEYCESFGVETEIIPGISSAIAAPASQKISVTQRGVSESFWVITGTTSSRKLSDDVKLAAQSTATVIILMGMSKLAEIVQIYKTFDKHDLPVAIIQNGTTQNEKTGLGTIETIEKTVIDQQLTNPAVIVIGDVVKYSPIGALYFDEFSYENEFYSKI